MEESFLSKLDRVIKAASRVHQSIADSDPSLRRGQVWCHKCGHTQKVDSASCLRHGWPLHCGETMSIDSPEERAARRQK